MTTHQLADLLEHLKLGLGSAFKADSARAFEEAACAFRELPDQPLSKVVGQLRNLNAPQAAPKKKGGTDLPLLIEQIRSLRADSTAPEASLLAQIDALKNPELKAILEAFEKKGTTKVADNRTRVKQLLTGTSTNGTHSPPALARVYDPEIVEEGVRLYVRLRDTRGLTITEVRSSFEPLRANSKADLEEISRRVGYTPAGTREDILQRLLTNLEGIKVNQQLADRIIAG